jgi:hypothetical protein
VNVNVNVDLSKVRAMLVSRLAQDLFGPSAADEVIEDRPSDRYLTGILFPRELNIAEEEQEGLAVEDGPESGQSEGDNTVLRSVTRPSSIGLSFATSGARPVVKVRVAAARYLRDTEDSRGKPRSPRFWRRIPRTAEVSVSLHEGVQTQDVAPDMPGLELFIRCSSAHGTTTATIALVNTRCGATTRMEMEEQAYFQAEISVAPEPGTIIVDRPIASSPEDREEWSAALIYRDVHQYAVGHTCSAEWDIKDGVVTNVRTAWIPNALIRSTSLDGDGTFNDLRQHPYLQPLSAQWLAQAPTPSLIAGLSMLPLAYEKWIDSQVNQAITLEPTLRAQAEKNLGECRRAVTRMQAAVDLIGLDHDVERAFRAANAAMLEQHRWSHHQDLLWRPFQLGFQLLTIPSLANGGHTDREVMDLLWFPTGGGKTEAYLGLVAFVLFLRRLRVSRGAEDSGAGVAVIMRYTLRLLTIQQFQRAARLICACELLRQGTNDLGSTSFSLGLWVGGAATPLTIREACTAGPQSPSSARQLTSCPACGGRLRWNDSGAPKAIYAVCENDACPVGGKLDRIPAYTVDEDLYRERPSLIIGTVDKFAQLARRKEAGLLLGVGTPHEPPDLIIQDELHLISGPLGTLAALYEVAIDQVCSRRGSKPKIIGSTATIRRAGEQIRALFDREAFQFPPPALDHSNSCFTLEESRGNGRLYLGLTTAGRSPKALFQAVCASLMQGVFAEDLSAEERDPYWTLLSYFGSLRELGGALALMQSFDSSSVIEYATRRGEAPRQISSPCELTSRKTQADVVATLDQLGIPADHEDSCDVVLASNMISVGVDVPRLGLMVVQSQPKAMAEYIQATSRVGRGEVPGLIVVLYNAARVRDRAHYETFSTWHAALYRDVEPASVTPFAARACDKALHATLVILVRCLVKGMGDSPRLRSKNRREVETLVDAVVARSERIDPEEASDVRQRLLALVDEWEARSNVTQYWDDRAFHSSLLISAEQYAAFDETTPISSRAWPTPNSMRTVEPGTPFVLVERLRS